MGEERVVYVAPQPSKAPASGCISWIGISIELCALALAKIHCATFTNCATFSWCLGITFSKCTISSVGPNPASDAIHAVALSKYTQHSIIPSNSRQDYTEIHALNISETRW